MLLPKGGGGLGTLHGAGASGCSRMGKENSEDSVVSPLANVERAAGTLDASQQQSCCIHTATWPSLFLPD